MRTKFIICKLVSFSHKYSERTIIMFTLYQLLIDSEFFNFIITFLYTTSYILLRFCLFYILNKNASVFINIKYMFPKCDHRANRCDWMISLDFSETTIYNFFGFHEFWKILNNRTLNVESSVHN